MDECFPQFSVIRGNGKLGELIDYILRRTKQNASIGFPEHARVVVRVSRRDHLEAGLDLAADLVREPDFPAEALDRLREKDNSKAELVMLRYFAGLTLPQAAAVLGIAQSTAEKHWTFAKFWLRSETRRIADQED